MRIYSRFDTPPKVKVDFSNDSGKTKQAFVDECDINNIMKKYDRVGGMVDPVQAARRQAIFGDFSGFGDFQDMHNKIIAAREAFGTLAASVRDRFQNDPAEVLRFLQDVNNREEAIRIGLIPKPDVAAPASSPAAGAVVPATGPGPGPA